MQTKVITLRDTSPIKWALQTFEEEHISGAPVVDAGGNVVGILSGYDIAQTRHLKESHITGEPGEYDYSYQMIDDDEFDESAFTGKEDYSPQLLGKDTAADWMNPRVISIGPDASLQEVCRIMATEGIHRVLVMNGTELHGIVSTLDVARYVADLE
jgi:CBS domain-containing protein